jgi:hypothetical protein
VFVEMLVDVIDHCVALGPAEAAPEERHDARIGIHGGECVPILLTPWAQADAAAGQRHTHAHGCPILCRSNKNEFFLNCFELGDFMSQFLAPSRSPAQQRPRRCNLSLYISTS